MSHALALIVDELPTGASVVSVTGELDVGTTPSLREWIVAASEGGTRSVVVDLRGVSFIAVSALHVLCDEQERLSANGAVITVVCDKPELLSLFRIVELDEVIEVVPTRDAARLRPPGRPPSEHLADWLRRQENDPLSSA
jgi:anti-sigma B factor antagonist